MTLFTLLWRYLLNYYYKPCYNGVDISNTREPLHYVCHFIPCYNVIHFVIFFLSTLSFSSYPLCHFLLIHFVIFFLSTLSFSSHLLSHFLLIYFVIFFSSTLSFSSHLLSHFLLIHLALNTVGLISMLFLFFCLLNTKCT